MAIEDEYGFDGNGLRSSESSGGATKYFAWDLSRRLPLLLTNGVDNFIYGVGGQPIEQIDAEGHALFLHSDQQGTTRLLTSTSGAIEGSATYDAYGNLTGTSGTGNTPMGYDGQYTDADTGLVYLRARAYDPGTAEFMSVDPESAITRSPFGFAAANPLNLVDPSGLCNLNPFEGGNCLEAAENVVNEGGETVEKGAEDLGNFSAGAADTLTAGLSTEGLEAIGIHPNRCSVSFEAGTVAGYAGVLVPGFGEEEAGAAAADELATDANAVTVRVRQTPGTDGAESAVIKETTPAGETVQVVHQVGLPLPGGGTLITHQHQLYGPLPGSQYFFPNVDR